MAEPSQAVVDEAVDEGETMSVRDLVERIERYHDGPGVDRDAVAAYARELESRRDYAFDAGAFLDDIERSAAGGGVPEDTLVEVVEAVGRVDRRAATEAIHEARDAGAVIEDADQHPQGAVYLRDRAHKDLLGGES